MTTKGKHLTLEDRNYIEDALNANYKEVLKTSREGIDGGGSAILKVMIR